MLLRFVLLNSMLSMVFMQQQSMIVTYGKPSNFSKVATFSTSDWNECVVHCYKLESCVLAHSPTPDVSCQIYSVNEVWEVKKLTSADDLLVAFKVLNDGQIETCPVGDNPPTFGNGSNRGFTNDGVANFSYQVDYQSSNSWVFSYTGHPYCPAGWTNFTRPLTDWCLKVFGAANVTYTYSQAEALCESQNSVVSGFETTAERDFSANTQIALLGPDYPYFSGIWIAGVRKPECTTDNWPSIDYCNNDIEQFTYTDKYLTNYAGYTWDPIQPDRNTSSEGAVWQNCIMVWIRDEAKFPGLDYDVRPNGNADDNICDQVEYNMFTIRGCVCGRLPIIP